MPRFPRLSRRDALASMMVAGIASTAEAFVRKQEASPSEHCREAVQTGWTEEPAQAGATEHMFAMPDGTRLWGWDTGGSGPAVLLMHAYTGSAATWGYQQPTLVRAGYRVVAYSRRGHYRSEPGPEDVPGFTIADMSAVLEQLGIDKFHLVGTAAGGFSVFDFAISHPDRLLSLTLSSSLGGIDEAEFLTATSALLPPGWMGLPAWFRELGPSYRAGNPDGVRRWVELQEAALPGKRIDQAKRNRIDWDALHGITTPALLMTGDADLYFPPSRMRQVALHLRRCRAVTIAEAGHAAFWEQPEAFNRQLLMHLAASAANAGEFGK